MSDLTEGAGVLSDFKMGRIRLQLFFSRSTHYANFRFYYNRIGWTISMSYIERLEKCLFQ